VILVVADTTRADVFEESAPGTVLDEAARRFGCVYPRAISPAPWTAPAHASMFTGLEPGTHGVWRPRLFDDQGHPRGKLIGGPLADRWLPRRLHDLGYPTFASSANPWVAPFFGFDLGFDRFDSLKEWSPRWASRAPSARLARRLPEGLAARLRRRRLKRRLVELGPDAGAARSLDALEGWFGDRSSPAFGFVNLMEPHWPYRPRAGFEGYTSAERRHAVDLLARLGQFKRFSIQAFLRQADLPEPDRVMLRRLYGDEVRYLRRRLDGFLERLEARDGFRDTVVVVTSDHGEQLGEHGLYGHGSSLHEELLHVPLVVLGPADLVGRGVEPARVSTIALYRACLAWARSERPHLATGPVLAEAEGMWYQPVVQRMGLAAPVVRRLQATSVALYDGNWKLVLDGSGDEALFDLASDPAESTRIQEGARIDSMRTRLTNALEDRPAAMWDEEPASPVSLDAAVEGQLRSLGYL